MTLSVDDLADVWENVHPVLPQWYNIGLKLSVPVNTLDNIRAQFRHLNICLQETLINWLVMNPNPTWRVLVDALRSPIVGELALADKIERKYLTQQKTAPTQGSTVITCNTLA